MTNPEPHRVPGPKLSRDPEVTGRYHKSTNSRDFKDRLSLTRNKYVEIVSKTLMFYLTITDISHPDILPSSNVLKGPSPLK